MNDGWSRVAVDEFLMVVDGCSVVVQCTRPAQQLVGCTAEEVVGQPVTHLVSGVAAGLVAMRGTKMYIATIEGIGARLVDLKRCNSCGSRTGGHGALP